MLFRRGGPATSMYLVTRGRIRLERALADGRLLTLAAVRAGDSLAEAALFADTYHCDAVAETAAAVVAYDCAAVRRAIAADAAFAEVLLARLARQVRDLRASLEIRNVQRARDRVLAFLAYRCWQGRTSWDRPLRALAMEVGLADETVYRTVAALEREGLVVRRGRCLTLAEALES